MDLLCLSQDQQRAKGRGQRAKAGEQRAERKEDREEETGSLEGKKVRRAEGKGVIASRKNGNLDELSDPNEPNHLNDLNHLTGTIYSFNQ